MNIICPFCGTEYRYPEENIRNGSRFRCSVCKNVFCVDLPQAEEDRERRPEAGAGSADDREGIREPLHLSGAPGEDAQAAPDLGLQLGAPGRTGKTGLSRGAAGASYKKRPRTAKAISAAVLLLLLFGGAFYAVEHTELGRSFRDLAVRQYHALVKGGSAPQAGSGSEAFSVEKHLVVSDVKQYTVLNKNIGNLLVIEGKVRNNFREPCEMIQVQGELYDGGGKMLRSQRRLAGAFISEAQLSLLEKDQLESLINNNVSIINNNFHVMYGAEVPFTLVFMDFPLEATDYKVKIMDAVIENTKGNLSQ